MKSSHSVDPSSPAMDATNLSRLGTAATIQAASDSCRSLIKPTPSVCDKFAHCHAPICPLDPHHLKSKHLNGEKACFFLGECVKPGAEARFRQAGREELYRVMMEALPGILRCYAPLRRALARAACTPSRGGGKSG